MAPTRERVLDWVRSYMFEHGQSPSLGQIARPLGISKQRVQAILRQLQREGHLKVQLGVPRSIKLADPLDNVATVDLIRKLNERGVPVVLSRELVHDTAR